MSLDKEIIRKKYKNIEEFLHKENGKHRCGCGCNESIELKKSHYWNGIPGYIFGHAARLRQGAKEFDTSRFYCVEDIASLAGVSDQTVRLWNRNNVIVATQTTGRKNLYLKQDIDGFLSKRPQKKAFNSNDYYTIQELKDMGVSRSKLRALARAGKIQEPRHHSRKTHYLKQEIDRYIKDIRDDKMAIPGRSRTSGAIISSLKDRIQDLEERVKLLEDCLLNG